MNDSNKEQRQKDREQRELDRMWMDKLLQQQQTTNAVLGEFIKLQQNAQASAMAESKIEEDVGGTSSKRVLAQGGASSSKAKNVGSGSG